MGAKPTFESLGEVVEDRVFEALRLRLRPDLGPTPKDERVRVPRNVIFYGPPGTGKTFVAQEVARALTGSEAPEEGGRWSIVQFHPSYAYEDFVQGLRPNIEETTLRYGLARGPFLRVCQDAAEDPDHFHVLIIDEINRGDPARIFGELLYGLEYRGHRIELPLGGQLEVPPNLGVIGTMNSLDRCVSVAKRPPIAAQ